VDENYIDKFNTEIKMAYDARKNGNEGMARVCARRAVGIIIGEYIQRNNLPDPGPNAYDRINFFIGTPLVPKEYQETVRYFTIRVTPEFQLPINKDLIEEANLLKTRLLEEK